MDIARLTNHVKFDEVFSRNTVNGKVQWCKIACDPNLPPQFIDQYFRKLKAFGIEKLQRLDDFIVSQHADELNWYSLLKYQSLSEEVLEENVERLTKQNLWPLAIRTQRLSYRFLESHLSLYRGDRRIAKALSGNAQIDESVKAKILGLVSAGG